MSELILKLDDAQVKLHRAMYSAQIEKIDEQIAEKQRERELYVSLLNALSRKPIEHPRVNLTFATPAPTAVLANGEYNPQWSIAKKAEYLIESAGAYLPTRSICELILTKEPAFLVNKGIDFSRFGKNVASTLIQKFEKDGTPIPNSALKRITVNGVVYYGVEGAALPANAVLKIE